jgi:hypothetical protein
VSSFAINGRIVFDGCDGLSALASATPSATGGVHEMRRRRLHADDDPRLHVFELVALLASEIRLRGDQVVAVDVE